MVTDALERERVEQVEAVETPAATTRPLVTVEKALYGLIVLVAAVLRLVHLNAPPLDAHEAGQAYQAYRLATGGGLPSGPYSPLLLTFNFITFALFGAGDAAARILPAVAGAALCGLPYWLRRWLGRPAGLAAATLLALSPSLVFFSRQVDESVITGLFTLAFLTMGVRYLMTSIPRRLTWAVVWLALALASGPAAWLFVVIAAGFALAVVYSGRDSVTREDLLAALRAMRDNRVHLVNSLLLGLALFVAVCTAVFFNPNGLQAAFNNLAAWDRPTPDSVSAVQYLLTLGVYETLALALGVVGGVWLVVRQRNLFAGFLGAWFLVALAVALLSPVRPASSVVGVVLPLTLLAGMALGRLADNIRLHAAWDREPLFLLFAIPFIVGPVLQVAAYVTNPNPPAEQGSRLLLILGIFIVFLAAILTAIGSLLGRGVAWRSLAILALLLLGVNSLRSMTSVTFPQTYVPQEFLGGPRTSHDVAQVANDLLTVGVDRFGARPTQLVAIDERLAPTWQWYLRWFPRIEVRNNVVGSTAPLLLAYAPPAGDPPAPPAGYIGQRGRYQSAWDPSGLDWRGWVRWYLYRDAPAAPARVGGFIWYARPAAPNPAPGQ